MRILLPYNQRIVTNSFYSDFHDGLTEAARELGHAAMRFDHADGVTVSAAEREALYRLLTEREFDLVIDLCGWSHTLSQLRAWDGTNEGEPLFDSFDMDYVAMLCDQPWFQPLTEIRSSRAHAAVPDRFHGEQIALIHPQLAFRSILLAPPAGRLANDRTDRTNRHEKAERPIDVLFVGNLYAESLERSWAQAPDARRYDDMLDWVCAHPDRPLHHALRAMTDVPGAGIDAAQAADLLRRVEFCLRARTRVDAVRAAAASGASMTVVGDGWAHIPLPANVTLHRFTDYAGFLGLAAQARISVDASTYRHGANDRVFNYAINGSVCFTNAAGYLSNSFDALDDCGGLHFYSTLELPGLGPAIRELLDSPARLREDAQRARATTLAQHTWRHRLESIISAVAAR